MRTFLLGLVVGAMVLGAAGCGSTSKPKQANSPSTQSDDGSSTRGQKTRERREGS